MKVDFDFETGVLHLDPTNHKEINQVNRFYVENCHEETSYKLTITPARKMPDDPERREDAPHLRFVPQFPE